RRNGPSSITPPPRIDWCHTERNPKPMIKAVITPLCLTLLLGTAVQLPAQAPAVNPAVEEGVRRQAAQIALRQKLEDASAAELRRDLPAAAKLYGDAWRLIESIGPGVEAEARRTVAGLTA